MLNTSKTLGGAIWVALAVLSFALPAYAAETVVNQQGLKFIPDTVTIAAGDTIRFTNSDRFFHDVTVVNPDGTTEDKGLQDFHHDQVVTFAKPGVYKVRCRLHPAMTVAVTVK
jgi:plastocyanin